MTLRTVNPTLRLLAAVLATLLAGPALSATGERSGTPSGSDATPFTIRPRGSSRNVPLADHVSGWVNVRSYGAKGDGTTDDTAAIQAAVTAAIASKAYVFFPPGTYRVTSRIDVLRPYGTVIAGAGRLATTIQWDGAAGADVIRIFNGRMSTVRDLSIYGKPAARPAALIRSLGDVTDPSMVAGPTALTFQNLQLGGAVADDHDYGIAYTWQNQDAANDQGRFVDLYITNSHLANVYLSGGNSKYHEFHRCQLFGGPTGVKTDSASFSLYGGFNALHTGYDFDITTPQDVVSIIGTGSEASAHFYVDRGPTGNTHATVLQSNHFAVNGMTASEPAILIQTAGPVTIRGNKFGDGVSGFLPKIQLEFVVAGAANISYNTWEVLGSYEASSSLILTPQAGPNLVKQEGNSYRDAGGTPHVLAVPNQYVGNTSIAGNLSTSGSASVSGTAYAGAVAAGSLGVGQNLFKNTNNVTLAAGGGGSMVLMQVGGITTAANSTTDPISGGQGALWTAGAGNLCHGAKQDVTYLAQQYTLSVYAKAGNYNYLALDMNSGGNQSAVFNLSNGTVGFTDAGVTSAISSAGNGWYRCSITRTQSAGAGLPEFYLNGASGANSRTWNAAGTETVYLWGAQLEPGTLGAYVATGASASTGVLVAPLGHVGSVSPDRGDTSPTLTVGTDQPTQRFATALTANRTVTLSTTGATNGDTFRVVRTGLGAFTLDVGGLKTIPSATAAFVDVSYNGSAWVLTGYGAL